MKFSGICQFIIVCLDLLVFSADDTRYDRNPPTFLSKTNDATLVFVSDTIVAEAGILMAYRFNIGKYLTHQVY